jgi:hypothetical protein
MKTFDELMASDIESKIAAMKALTSMIDRSDVLTMEDIKDRIDTYTGILNVQLKGYRVNHE